MAAKLRARTVTTYRDAALRTGVITRARRWTLDPANMGAHREQEGGSCAVDWRLDVTRF